METMAVQNKTVVLDAFDTLFNKRDYTAQRRSFGRRTTFSTALTSTWPRGTIQFSEKPSDDAQV